MENAWYSRSFRRSLVDMHIDDWNPLFLSQFDPQAYYECLKAAHIQTPMIYTHSHVGLCNWDSKSGRVHKAFAGENKIRKLFDLCHEGGMSVVAYYSLIYNNWAYDAHPDWRMLDRDGLGAREVGATHGFMSGSRYGLVCPNNRDYREFLKLQFTELTEAYAFEAIFLDMTFWPQVCYCDACRARFREEEGLELPTEINWKDPAWVKLQLARQRWMGEFAAFCTDYLKTLRPGLAVEHQFSTIAHAWNFGIDEKVNLANDYTGGDLYGGPLAQSYICKLFTEATANQPFEYMTSRCDPRLSVHTTTKSLYALKLQNYLTLAHHGAFLVIDAIDPIGTLDKRVYDRVGQVFEESMPYERYLVGTPVTEAALVMSYDSKFDPHAAPAPDRRADTSHPQLTAQLGLTRALQEARILFTALPGNRLDRLTGKRLAAVTDAPLLREEEIDRLVSFVREGGSLYLSGATDPRLAKALLGLEYEGMTESPMTYAAPTAAGTAVFGDEYNAAYPISYEGPMPLMKDPQGHTVLATVTLPYTDPAQLDIFASIHSNPPGIATDFPAAIEAQVGKGRVLWLAFCPEKSESFSLKQMTVRLMTYLCPPQVIASDAPGCLWMTLFKDEGGYTLHMVNVQPEPALPVGPYTVTLALPVKTAALAPDGTPVPLTDNGDGTVTLALPAPGLFATVRLEA